MKNISGYFQLPTRYENKKTLPKRRKLDCPQALNFLFCKTVETTLLCIQIKLTSTNLTPTPPRNKNSWDTNDAFKALELQILQREAFPKAVLKALSKSFTSLPLNLRPFSAHTRFSKYSLWPQTTQPPSSKKNLGRSIYTNVGFKTLVTRTA